MPTDPYLDHIEDRQRRYEESLKHPCPHGAPLTWLCTTCRATADWWTDEPQDQPT